MLKSLYRKGGQCAILLLCFAIGSTAQLSRAAKRSQGPRALALVQKSGKSARLIPVTIMVDGTLYDASVYRAAPRPMALEPGTVYEVERSGSPEGLFTVGAAQQIGNTWYGLGEWQPASAAQPAKAAAISRPAASSPEDGPPILRRSGSSSGSGPGSGSKSAPASSNPPPPDKGRNSGNDSSKPDSSTSGQSSTETPNTPSNEDDQRPVLRRPNSTSGNSSTTASPSPSASPTTAQEDSDRPLLRRGKPPNPTPQTSVAGKDSTVFSGTANARSGRAALAGSTSQLLPAISDATGPEPRPFKFFFKPGEEAQIQNKVQAIAKRAINAYEKVRQPGLIATELQPGSFHAFDVDFSNQPVFVYTAQATLAPHAVLTRAGSRTRSAKKSPPRGISGTGAATSQPPVAYTTVVARVDIYGDLKEIFSSVTDSRHLDEIPRLALIDAVDVDGDERGELLFSEFTNADQSYVIYRVTTDHLIKLFESSGAGE